MFAFVRNYNTDGLPAHGRRCCRPEAPKALVLILISFGPGEDIHLCVVFGGLTGGLTITLHT